MSDAPNRPGQSCPVAYRYQPSSLRREPSHCAETLYVIGGLYGNVHALRTILEMQQAEARAGSAVSLVFNGDYNWFNAQPAAFREINEAVLANIAIQGNVEAELAQPTDAGCSCNYPEYADLSIHSG